MTTTGKSLMEMESEKRGSFMKGVQLVLGVPVACLGILLLYFGYSERDYLYLFLYFALGLILMLFGFIMITSGIPSGRKVVITSTGPAKGEAPKPAGKCQKCGAKIISAGKFCGNCGSLLEIPPAPDEQ